LRHSEVITYIRATIQAPHLYWAWPRICETGAVHCCHWWLRWIQRKYAIFRPHSYSYIHGLS